MLLTLQEIKDQLKLDSDDEDTLLELLGNAVQKRTETFLNRTLYEKPEDIPEEDTEGLTLSSDLKLGMLLLLTHYYENRSSVSEVEKLEMPMSFTWLVGPYRFIPL